MTLTTREQIEEFRHWLNETIQARPYNREVGLQLCDMALRSAEPATGAEVAAMVKRIDSELAERRYYDEPHDEDDLGDLFAAIRELILRLGQVWSRPTTDELVA